MAKRNQPSKDEVVIDEGASDALPEEQLETVAGGIKFDGVTGRMADLDPGSIAKTTPPMRSGDGLLDGASLPDKGKPAGASLPDLTPPDGTKPKL